MKQKLKIHEFEIEVNVRTNLKVKQGAYSVEILGFDGENSLVIIATGRQDKKISYIVVKTAVDDVTKLVTPQSLCWVSHFGIIISEIIESVFNY